MFEYTFGPIYGKSIKKARFNALLEAFYISKGLFSLIHQGSNYYRDDKVRAHELFQLISENSYYRDIYNSVVEIGDESVQEEHKVCHHKPKKVSRVYERRRSIPRSPVKTRSIDRTNRVSNGINDRSVHNHVHNNTRIENRVNNRNNRIEHRVNNHVENNNSTYIDNRRYELDNDDLDLIEENERAESKENRKRSRVDFEDDEDEENEDDVDSMEVESSNEVESDSELEDDYAGEDRLYDVEGLPIIYNTWEFIGPEGNYMGKLHIWYEYEDRRSHYKVWSPKRRKTE